jgi:hypothetical protein
VAPFSEKREDQGPPSKVPMELLASQRRTWAQGWARHYAVMGARGVSGTRTKGQARDAVKLRGRKLSRSDLVH